MKRESKTGRKETVILVLFFLLICLIFAACSLARGKQCERPAKREQKEDVRQKVQDQPEKETAEETTIEAVPFGNDSVQITISTAGDCTLGTDHDFDYDTSLNSYVEWKGSEYFFANVRSIFENDDLTIVNLEGPLTESADEQEKTFAFKGNPSFVKILTSGGVEAVNLANNHSRDYGEEGYEDTIRHTEEAGLISFGYDRTAIAEIKGVKVGLVGIYELADGMGREKQLTENIQAVKKEGASLVIVSFHWGQEKENYPDETQQKLAHIAVDQGADLVVGHHPHVLQGIENYKGKNIVYSLGNFCFGGNRNPGDKDTMIFQQTFTVTKDNVLGDNKVNIIPCRVSSQSDYNDYQPTPVEGEERERILKRIEEYSQFD